KAKEKGVAITDLDDSSRTVKPIRSIITLQPLPTIDPKDKGKGVLVKEEPVKIKMRDQELERRQKERVAQEEASMAVLYEEYDTIQASIDIDDLFATKLQQEEREQFTIEERSQFLVETINIGDYKYSQLKGKTYEEIHRLYERQQKRNQDFIPMDTEVINDSGKKNDSSSKPAGG
ncbi:hypothetical protein Tco_1334174, partial [Tanacetum coccineum]